MSVLDLRVYLSMVICIHNDCAKLSVIVMHSFDYRNKSVSLSLICYAAFSSIDFAFNEIYSVWAKTSPRLGENILHICSRA